MPRLGERDRGTPLELKMKSGAELIQAVTRAVPVQSPSRMWKVVGSLAVTGLTAFTTALVLPVPMASAAAFLVFCISMWITAAVPEWWPALTFFLVAVVLHVAPAETVFSGF